MQLIKINLLSKENIKKEERTELVLLAFLILIIAVAVMSFFYFSKLIYLNAVESRISQAQMEMNKYESIVKQVDELEATKKALETKKNVINMLRDNGVIYPHFMQDLISVMPSGISLKTLSTTMQPDGKIKASINGDSIDNYPIADFFTQLSVKDVFSDIELGAISTTRATDKGAISSFSISFNWQRKK